MYQPLSNQLNLNVNHTASHCPRPLLVWSTIDRPRFHGYPQWDHQTRGPKMSLLRPPCPNCPVFDPAQRYLVTLMLYIRFPLGQIFSVTHLPSLVSTSTMAPRCCRLPGQFCEVGRARALKSSAASLHGLNLHDVTWARRNKAQHQHFSGAGCDDNLEEARQSRTQLRNYVGIICYYLAVDSALSSTTR